MSDSDRSTGLTLGVLAPAASACGPEQEKSNPDHPAKARRRARPERDSESDGADDVPAAKDETFVHRLDHLA